MTEYFDYRLDVKSPSGVLLHSINDFDWLYASKGVNRPGTLRTRLRGDHKLIADLSHKSQIELWRRDPSNDIDWYRWFSGLYLRPRYDYKEYSRFELTAIGDLWMLGTRVVAYYAGVENRSLYTNAKAETIMKSIYYNNCGAGSTTGNGRLRNGVIPGLGYAPDIARGNTVTWRCFGDNVLETLQDLSKIGGGDFDLVKSGAATWTFDYYPGQLGDDQTAKVKFSLDAGNMANPVYTLDRVNEVTVAIAGGKGEGNDREFIVRTGADYIYQTNDVEIFFNGGGMESAELTAAADKRLMELRAKEDFEFDVIQTQNTIFDKDYFLGDLVSVVNPFLGSVYTRKIDFVSITLDSDGSQKIDVEIIPLYT